MSALGRAVILGIQVGNPTSSEASEGGTPCECLEFALSSDHLRILQFMCRLAGTRRGKEPAGRDRVLSPSRSI